MKLVYKVGNNTIYLPFLNVQHLGSPSDSSGVDNCLLPNNILQVDFLCPRCFFSALSLRVQM